MSLAIYPESNKIAALTAYTVTAEVRLVALPKGHIPILSRDRFSLELIRTTHL